MNYKILVSLFIFNIYHVNLPMDTSTTPNGMYTHTHALIYAVEHNDLETVNKLLTQGPLLQQATNRNNLTALQIAAQNNQPEIINALIRHGANPNLTDRDGRTALHSATNADAVELLLRLGANPNLTDRDGKSPLFMACYGNNIEIVQALLNAGANPNIANNKNWTPLHLAGQYFNAHVIDLLIQAGADVNALNNQRETPLQVLVGSCTYQVSNRNQAQAYESFQRLLNFGTNPNNKDLQGNTLLHRPAITFNPEFLKTLLAKRPDPLIKNNAGQTAADVALSSNIRAQLAAYENDYRQQNQENLKLATELLKRERTQQGKTGDDYGQLIKIASKYL